MVKEKILRTLLSVVLSQRSFLISKSRSSDMRLRMKPRALRRNDFILNISQRRIYVLPIQRLVCHQILQASI